MRGKLSTKGVICHLLCLICRTQKENLVHTFFKCDRAKRVWFGSNLSLNMNNEKGDNMVEWIWNNINDMDNNTIKIIMVMIYGIWWLGTKVILKI